MTTDEASSSELAGFCPPELAEREYCISEPESRTDAANGKRFARDHSGRVRYCPELDSWLAWDSRRWVVGSVVEVEQLAKQTADAIWQEISPHLNQAGHEGQYQLLRFGNYSNSARGLGAMLKTARSEPALVVKPETLDAHPWLLNVENGTIDLRTGELLPHDRSHLLTKVAPVSYNPYAKCPRWDRFVREIMAGDLELVGFLRRFAGYALTGSGREHKIPIFHGYGSNGKSRFIEIIRAVMGTDYSTSLPLGMLISKKQGTHYSELEVLRGMRFADTSETEQGRSFNEALLKALVSEDNIQSRGHYEKFSQYRPPKIILATNHKPEIKGVDSGIWRRVAIVPFSVRFWDPDKGETGPPTLEQDKQLPEKLLAELPGILAWCVRGCLEWQSDGLKMPESVIAATDSYRAENDHVVAFIQQRCILKPGARVQGSALFKAYDLWCGHNGCDPLTETKFGTRLTRDGFPSKPGPGNKYKERHGIGLLHTGPEGA